jgi:hypothetical protein
VLLSRAGPLGAADGIWSIYGDDLLVDGASLRW